VADLTLEIVEGESAGRTIALHEPLEVGRSQGLGIVLEDTEVSRRHARITPSGGGAVVEDLGSRNGSFVNEQPIDGPRQVGPGDRVRCGLTIFELHSAEQVARGVSGVMPVPQITELGHGVLEPVQVQDLPPPAPEPQLPGFRVPQTDPAYVPGGDPVAAAGGPGPQAGPAQAPGGSFTPGGGSEEGTQYRRVAGLRDPRVKQRTSVVAFALLGIVAIALLVFFGLVN